MYTVEYSRKEPPGRLFHYTSAVALESIVRERHLWATDIRFLNDSTELRLGIERLRSRFDALPMGEPDGYLDDDQNAPFWDGSVGQVVRSHLAEMDSTFRSYVSCFCGTDDLLSQWRGYTAEFGYSIGFDSLALGAVEPHIDDFDSPNGAVLAQARYDQAEFDEILDRWAKQIHEWRAGHPGTKGWSAMWWMMHLLASIKDSSFVEENEWRLVLTKSAHNLPDDTELRFRASRLGLVPFVRLPFEAAAVKTVRVGPGPNPELRAHGLRDLLDRLGFGHVEVYVSSVPYRP